MQTLSMLPVVEQARTIHDLAGRPGETGQGPQPLPQPQTNGPQGQPPARRPVPSSQPQTEQPTTTQVLLPSRVTDTQHVIGSGPVWGIIVTEVVIRQQSM